LRAHGGRDEDVAGLLEDVGVRDRVGVGDPDNATALGDASRELTDVEAPRIPDAAVDIGDADDVAAFAPLQARDHAADVADSLDDDTAPLELLAQTPGRFQESIDDHARGN
jgi:hypothetical protein